MTLGEALDMGLWPAMRLMHVGLALSLAFGCLGLAMGATWLLVKELRARRELRRQEVQFEMRRLEMAAQFGAKDNVIGMRGRR